MLRVLAFLTVAAIATQSFAQAPRQENPPTLPRAESPAQSESGQPGMQAPGQQPAAQPGQPQQRRFFRGSESAGTEALGSKNLDGPLSACLILSNEEEVALARFAKERASSDKVKQFAQQMIDDHSKAISQLKQFAPQGASLQLSQSSEQGGVERRRDQALSSTVSNQSDKRLEDQMLEVGRETTQACLSLTQEELGKHRGEEFDQAYLGQQIGGHIGMVAHLRTYERHASPEMRKVIQEQLQTAEKHLDHVRDLKHQAKRGETTSR